MIELLVALGLAFVVGYAAGFGHRAYLSKLHHQRARMERRNASHPLEDAPTSE